MRDITSSGAVAAGRRACQVVGLAAALLGGVTAPAGAHHSAAPHFDLEKTVVLNGVVTRFEFVNPHAYVYFDVRGAEGVVAPWRCELAARVALMRLGWTVDLFPAGRKLTFKGAPARREENVCMLTSFAGEDGVEIGRNDDVTRLRSAAPLTVASAIQPGSRPARLANGLPNLKGPWVAQFGPGRGRPGGPPGGPGGRPGGPGGPGRGPGGPGGGLEPTAAGALAAEKYDQRFDDPAIKCNPANVLFGWTHDQHVNEVVQQDNEVILQYGYMDFVRTIHMNASHPRTITPTTAGHSVGRWEGDVLVVDTVGFAPSVLIPISGVMHSDRMHVIERFSVDPDRKTLTRAYRAEDPLYLKATYTGTDVMLLSNEPFVPYNCVELSGKNNLRPK